MSNKNIIFKYNFCDGGADTENIGFNGICSKENIKYNNKLSKQIWCSNPDSPCFQYLNGDYSYEQLEGKILENREWYSCYESKFFREHDGWEGHMGWDHTGQGRPRMLSSWVDKNSLCVMTTRNPNASEPNRIVFAVFLASYCYPGDERIAGYIKAHEKYRIKFTPKEARELLLWKYHANKNNPTNPKWGSGLTRPFSNEGATALLHDIMKIKQSTADAKLAKDFFEHFCELNDFDAKSPPKADGALLYQ